MGKRQTYDRISKRYLKVIEADDLRQLLDRVNSYVDKNNVVILNYSIEKILHGSKIQAVLFIQPIPKNPEDMIQE